MDDFWKWVAEQTGNILGVAGLVTGFIFWCISRRPKRFGWEIMSQTPILSAKSGHLPLKVVYDGKDVSSPTISVVRLGNTGKVELQNSDFDGPVKIGFDKSDILQVLVSARSTDEINPSISQDTSNSICFTPALLNPGEWIEFQLVTDGPCEAPTVRARVAGQTSSATDGISQRKERVGKAAINMLLGGLILFTISFFFNATVRDVLMSLGGGIFILGVIAANFSERPMWSKLPKQKKSKRAMK